MHKVTFFPLGNADSYLIELANGQKLLFDYADVRDPADSDDKRVDLPAALRSALGDHQSLDVIGITHADDDHTHGAGRFFYLEHAKKYQDAERVKVEELWVPAALIVEPRTNLQPDARVLQAEAQYRLKEGKGIRVFSRPDRLKDWLKEQGIDLADRAHLITDAGRPIPGFEKVNHGVEFFVHSPFAERLDDSTIVDRNDCSLVLQATFEVEGVETCMILSADTTWENFIPMIAITQHHGNEDRLMWDIFKLPHHCSYLSLSSEKGKDVTEPVDEVKWLFEEQPEPSSSQPATPFLPMTRLNRPIARPRHITAKS